MAVVPGPPTSLAQVRAVFGAPAGTPLHDFYRGGPWVPNVPQNAGVPPAPPIRLAQLAGATNYQPPVLSGPTTVNWNGYNDRPPVAFNTGTGQSVSGNTNPYTVNWSPVSGNTTSIVCLNTGALGGPFQAHGGVIVGDPVEYTAVYRLTINDGVTQIQKDVTFHFTAN